MAWEAVLIRVGPGPGTLWAEWAGWCQQARRLDYVICQVAFATSKRYYSYISPSMAKARRPRSKGKPPARLDVYEAEEEVPAEEKFAGQRYDVRLSLPIL